jgi:hypothetical protein
MPTLPRAEGDVKSGPRRVTPPGGLGGSGGGAGRGGR